MVTTDEASSGKGRRKAMQWFATAAVLAAGSVGVCCWVQRPDPSRFVTAPLTRGDVVIDKMNAGIGGGGAAL